MVAEPLGILGAIDASRNCTSITSIEKATSLPPTRWVMFQTRILDLPSTRVILLIEGMAVPVL